MHKILTTLYFLLLCFSSLEGSPKRPSYIDPVVWEQVAPYVMPDDHPIKSKLDKLFSSTRVLKDSQAIRLAGFEKSTPRDYSNAIVSKHSKIKHYYFKMFADDQPNLSDWQQWVTRAKGAQMTRESIIAHGYQKYFAVPKKWIYVLPEFPAPPPNYYRKNFILVAEDMNILKKSANYARWKSSAISSKVLDAVYIILQDQGLGDSAWPFNMPFNKYGYITFIDTEHHLKQPVPFGRLTSYLSSKNKSHWEWLITHNGPTN